ncbi:hypothetical protein ACO0LO_03685 [Undibacterium sp. TJN25]|uniref:hypothetical protein n=1 Tax=Undibacterium sp. TJN25 TaxID=3413056 RepID=UPI003BEF7EC7
MERKYYFEIGNWDEAAWLVAKHDPERFQDEKVAKTLLKNTVIDALSAKSLDELKRFDPLVYGPIMALPSAFLQSSAAGEYESVHVHFWHCLATLDHSTVEVQGREHDAAPEMVSKIVNNIEHAL